MQKNNVPYIFDVVDRYPEVLFDLNVIFRKKPNRQKALVSRKTCYSYFFDQPVTRGIDEEIDPFQKPHEHIPNGFDGEIFLIRTSIQKRLGFQDCISWEI